jgi:hypothetical protein
MSTSACTAGATWTILGGRDTSQPESSRASTVRTKVWREYATDVRGRALPCGHYLSEEESGEVAEELVSFLEG